MSRRTTAYLLLLLVSIIWGTASPVVKYTLQWFDPWIFLTYRFAISALIALPALWITKTKFPTKSKDVGLVLITSILSAPLSLWLFFEALTKTTALSGSLFTATGPLLLVLGGAIFFHERIRSYERWGIAITIFGTLITAFSPFLFGGQKDSLGPLEGNLIMFIAVVTDMSGALLSKEAVKRNISPALLAHIQFIIGFVIFVPLLLLRQSPDAIWQTIMSAPWQAHMGVLFMAVLSGTVAYTIRNIAIKRIEVSESGLFTYLQPLWAAILAVMWLHEPITMSYIIGGIIIALGVVVAESKGNRNKKKK
ncbi:DMT family transporter [Candidatus Woesebacteria bacterium]|jgi:drug/metabolite transporter (DMT)-like permease|nr:DMT family transporter [Candidatus Woesebacteria bacterium]